MGNWGKATSGSFSFQIFGERLSIIFNFSVTLTQLVYIAHISEAHHSATSSVPLYLSDALEVHIHTPNLPRV